MRRRQFLSVLGGATVWPLAARAQRNDPPRIGYLFSLTQSESRHLWEACRTGLRELAYTEGRNILVEPRWAEGKYERLPGLVAELESLKVDVIVAAADADQHRREGRQEARSRWCSSPSLILSKPVLSPGSPGPADVSRG